MDGDRNKGNDMPGDEEDSRDAVKKPKPEKSGKSESSRRRRGKGRVIWFVVGIVIVAALIINSWLVNRRLYAPTPYGAFHKLADVLGPKITLKRIITGLIAEFVPSQEDYKTAVLEKELNRFDEKYGHISEYWEMRKRTPEMTDLECYERALAIAPDVPDVVYLKALAEFKAIDDSFPKNKNAQWKPEWDTLKLDAIRHASEFEPDNGAWHFLAACQLNQLGEWDESVEEMKLAADASFFRMPRTFPAREWDSILLDLYENPRIAFQGWSMLSSARLPNYISIKDAYKNALVAISLSGDIDAMNAYHRVAVRMTCSESSSFIDRLVGAVLVQVIADGYLEIVDRDCAGERIAVKLVVERMDGFVRALKSSQTHYSFPAEMQLTGTYTDFFEKKNLYLYGYSKLGRQMIAQEYVNRKFRSDLAKSTFEPLLAFDYNDPVGSLEAIEGWEMGRSSEEGYEENGAGDQTGGGD